MIESSMEFSTNKREMYEEAAMMLRGLLDDCPHVIASLANDGIIHSIAEFQQNGDTLSLESAVKIFMESKGWNLPTMLLEVSKHFEEGAEKYGENNWQKGIPVNCYINSAVRHYLKWLRGDTDEYHDRAFCWNIIAACWTCLSKPELNPYGSGMAKRSENVFSDEQEV